METKDTHSYKGWLNSDSFIKRSLAVFGYSFMGQLLVMLALIILAFLPLSLLTYLI